LRDCCCGERARGGAGNGDVRAVVGNRDRFAGGGEAQLQVTGGKGHGRGGESILENFKGAHARCRAIALRGLVRGSHATQETLKPRFLSHGRRPHKRKRNGFENVEKGFSEKSLKKTDEAPHPFH
jgi:hypothetical protein